MKFNPLILLILFFLIFGCNEATKVDLPDPETAESIIPSIPEYTNTPITNEVAIGIAALGEAASKTAEPSLVASGEVTKKLGIFLTCYKKNNGVEIQLISAKTDVFDQTIIAVGEENLGKILSCVSSSIMLPSSVVYVPKSYGLYYSNCRIKDSSTWNISVLSTVKETVQTINNKIPGCNDVNVVAYYS